MSILKQHDGTGFQPVGTAGSVAQAVPSYSGSTGKYLKSNGSALVFAHPGTSSDLFMSDYDTDLSVTEHAPLFDSILADAAALIASGTARVRIVLDSRPTYTIGRAVQTGANGQYAQVPLPFSRTSAGTIEFFGGPGEAPPLYIGLGQSGTVIKSTLASAPTWNGTVGIASIFGGPTSFSSRRGFTNLNHIEFGFKNVTIRSAAPVICGVDVGWCNGLWADGLAFDTDQVANFPGGYTFTSSSLTPCTAPQAIPIVFPQVDCYRGATVGKMSVTGWRTGPQLGELGNIEDLLVNFVTGPVICSDVGYHGNRIGLLRDWNNAYGVAATYPDGTHQAYSIPLTSGQPVGPASQATASNGTLPYASPLVIGLWDNQPDGNQSAKTALQRVYDLMDENNVTPVEASYCEITAGVGATQGQFRILGPGASTLGTVRARIKENTRTPGPQTAPALPATTVKIRNPFFQDALVTISGGTVTAITVNGTATGATSGAVLVPSCGTIAVTYSAAPTWAWQTF